MPESFVSRLPPASFEPEALPSLGTPAAVPVVPLDLAPKEIDPNARASLGGFTTEDAGGAKPIDLTAREQLGGFKNPGDEFDDAPPEADPANQFDDADPLDARPVSELNTDRENFDPVSYFAANPDVANDPARLKKLLDVRRLRDEEGLTAGGVIKAAKKGGPEAAKGFVPAAKQVVENIVDVTVQPIANFAIGALTGDLYSKKSREALFAGPKKSLGELSAAAEASATGMIDLARQTARKVESESHKPESPGLFPPRPLKPGEFPGLYPDKKPVPKTDQQLLAEMADDAAFRKNAVDILGGSGEGAKLVNLDAETLAKEGITLDPKAIEAISLVEPLTMVAGGGVFKLLGAAGKVIGTAKTLAGAEKLVDGLTKYAKTSGALKLAGKASFKTGEALANKNPSIIAGYHALTTGNITGLAATSAAKFVVSPAAKAMGAEMFDAGRILAGELAPELASKGVNRLATIAKAGAETAGAVKEVAKDVFGGAVKGGIAAAPFALGSYDDEQAGRTLGAGIILGAGAGAAESGGKAFRVVKNAAAREYFGPNRKPIPAVDSPGYGRVPALDEMNVAQKAKLSTAAANELDNFREGLRNQGREIYAVDRATFRTKAAERYKAQTGNEIDPALLDRYEQHHALFDETNPDGTKVVYLNADAGGAAALQHDAGHLFDSLLSPEKVSELNTAIDKAFTPEQQKAFRDNYEKRVGNKISDEDAKSEFRGEMFGALFHNLPVSEMAAPKGLLKTFADVVAGGAEAMGVDIAGGATTPNLGAPQKVGLRNMFESAARTVLEEGKGKTPAAAPEPPVVAPEPAPAPAPAPVAPPAAARPIRTTPEAPKTPEARAAAARRFEATGIAPARELAAKLADPVGIKAVEDISAQMESGNPVLEVEHLGITSEGTPATPEGRTSRRATQAAAYETLKGELSRAGAPADLVTKHLKTFVPVRWEPQGGSPTLIAMSLDKVLTNLKEIAKKAADSNASKLIPYPVENGTFTAEGWTEAVSDFQKYAENQANGRKGDGGRLEVPEAGELSIPAENPNYTPQPLSPEKANFANLIQGLGTPETARSQKGKTPGNIKGQLVAEANRRPVELPSNIPLKQAGKQAFVGSLPSRVVQEVNPLRNRMKEAGVNTKNLLEVTERIRAQDIEKVTPRPDLNFKAPVTDIIRGGFSPAPTEFRQKNLQGKTVSEFSDYVLTASPGEWKAATENMNGGLTGGAWNLGLGLKDAADVGVLKSFQDRLSTATKEAMTSGDFDSAYSLVSKGQFFREAYEAATGTGSAGAAFKRGQMGTEGVKVPFPIESPAGFSPAKESSPTLVEARQYGEIIRLEFDAGQGAITAKQIKEEFSGPGRSVEVRSIAPDELNIAQGRAVFEVIVGTPEGPYSSKLAEKTYQEVLGTDKPIRGKSDIELALPLNERLSRSLKKSSQPK